MKLKQARIEQSLTQREVADKLGIDQSHVSHLEAGNYTPSFALLVKITELFTEVKIEDFLLD
jgi:DNA-binding XRE family transcriptional regulator